MSRPLKRKLFAILALALMALVTLPAFAATPDPNLRMHRVVEWKPVNAPDTDYVVFKNRDFTHGFPGNLFAIDTIFWHDQGTRMETLFLHDISFPNERTFQATIDFQKNDFPMDAEWDVIWTRPFFLQAGEKEVFFSEQVGMQYRITFELLLIP